ncbi:MAG: hypothetical protein ACRDQB_11380, partial [Thermocrispum sp.]
MRFLFLTFRSPATVYAVAPLVTAVRNAGHEVLMATNEPLMDTAEAVGVPAISIMPQPVGHFMPDGRPASADSRARDLGAEMQGFGLAFARMAAAGLQPLLDLAGYWRPDLIVGGSMSYVAGLLATELQVPYVRHAEYLAIPTAAIDPVAEEELLPELKRVGLPGLPDPALFIDATPPSL